MKKRENSGRFRTMAYGPSYAVGPSSIMFECGHHSLSAVNFLFNDLLDSSIIQAFVWRCCSKLSGLTWNQFILFSDFSYMF